MFELDRALAGAQALAHLRMVEPLFERANGERPHANGTTIVLDEEDLRRRAKELTLIASLASIDRADSDRLRRKILMRISFLADQLVRHLEKRTGLNLYEPCREEAAEHATNMKEQLRAEIEGEEKEAANFQRTHQPTGANREV